MGGGKKMVVQILIAFVIVTGIVIGMLIYDVINTRNKLDSLVEQLEEIVVDVDKRLKCLEKGKK
jgi:uncharacterized membrane-anchored protein YhcB (DUF1043 family)